MSTLKTIRRKIANRAIRHNPGYGKHWAVGGSVVVTLEGCGHQIVRKLSQEPKPFALVRCLDCEKLQAGVWASSKVGNGPWVRTTWDPVTQLPVRQELPVETLPPC